MSRGTEEAVDDSLLANKVRVALYSDKQVSGRQIAVEASQGVIQLTGVVGSPAEAQRAVQITQQVQGVKEGEGQVPEHVQKRVQERPPGIVTHLHFRGHKVIVSKIPLEQLSTDIR
jgi:hypothetical protein